MARPKSIYEPDAEDLELIIACKIERARLRNQLTALGPNARKQKCNRELVEKLRRDIAELSNESLAVKFGTTYWVVSRL